MKKLWAFVALLVVISMLAACGATPEPEVVEVEKIVTQVVEVEKEVEKIVTEVVEKEVQVEVTPVPEAKPYEGVEVNILTFTGPQIAEPLQRRGPDFTELTGAKINVIIVPFSDLYQKILTDAATGTNAFDAWVFAPQWMVDYVEPGYLEDLTARMEADTALGADDNGQYFRDFRMRYGGKT